MDLQKVVQIGVVVGDHGPAGVVANSTDDQLRCRGQGFSEHLVNRRHVTCVGGGNRIGGHGALLVMRRAPLVGGTVSERTIALNPPTPTRLVRLVGNAGTRMLW